MTASAVVITGGMNRFISMKVARSSVASCEDCDEYEAK